MKAVKLAGLAVALGLVTWLAAPYLLPVKLPADFPPLADLHSASPDLRMMLEGLDREARRKPGSAEAVGKLGMGYHANQFFDQAASAYRIAARLAPNDYQWTYARAYLNEETGNEKDSLVQLQQTVRLKPDYVPALIKLADASFKLDQLDQAAHYYKLAAEAAGGTAALQAIFGQGRVAARRQDWAQVIAVIEPLSRTYSYVLPLFELLEEAYGRLGQPDKAAEAKQKGAVATWRLLPPPDDPLSDQLIGYSYSSTRLLKYAGLMSRTGRPDRGLEIARRAVQADPSDPGVRNFIGYTILTFYGDQPAAVDEALTQLTECLRLAPNDLGPLWNFAGEFFKTPKQPAAVERLRAILQPYAFHDEAHYPLGLTAEAQGKTDEAISQYQAALKVTPKDSAVYNKLGQIYLGTGKLDAAVTAFQKSVALNANNNGARLNLGVALMQRSRYGDAVKELNELLRRAPQDAPAQFCMGFALLYSKRADEAIARFREGLRYKPDDAEAHYGLGSALLARGMRQDAIAELRESLRLRPDQAGARELLQSLGQ